MPLFYKMKSQYEGLPQEPFFRMECPYNSEQFHCQQFTSVWNYLNHLLKCHIINQKVFDGAIATFFMCHKCLKIFEKQELLIEHHSIKHIYQLQRISPNEDDQIRLSKKGLWEIRKMIENYKEIYLNNKIQNDVPELFQNKPILTDPRLHTPKDIMGRISHLQVDKKEKLKIFIPQQFSIESAFYKLYNHYKDLTLINKDFPQKMTEATFYQQMHRSNIKLTNDLYNQTRVCEFMEQSLTKEEDHAIYMNKRTINKYSYIWLLIHEDVNPFKDIQFQEPWAILAIPTQKDQLQTLQQESNKYTKEIEELQKQLDIEMAESKRIEAEQYKQDQKKIEEMKYLGLREKKLEQLEKHLSITLSNLSKHQTDFEVVKEEYQNQSNQKLAKAKSDLEAYYKVQEERIKNDLMNQQIFKDIEMMNKKREKLQLRVVFIQDQRDQMYHKTQQLKNDYCNLQDKIKAQIRKKSSGNYSIIVQHLCIRCKKRIRQVIHLPCQHFLFCTECHIKGMVEKKQYCPLLDIGQCNETRPLEQKFKTVNFYEGDGIALK